MIGDSEEGENMSILMTADRKELIVNCKCGCESGAHIIVDDDEKEDDYYAIMSYTNGNFYTEQYGMFRVMLTEAILFSIYHKP